MACRTERAVVRAESGPLVKKSPPSPPRVTGRPMGSPFGYYGSKLRIATKLVSDLPPHNAWVEAFCGSAAVTLAKRPAPIEIINDVNGEIVNFFRQLRDNWATMKQLLLLTPYSREEFATARAHESGLSDEERARRFFVSAMMAINGSFGEDAGGFSFSNSYSRRGMEARVSRWTAAVEDLDRIVDRLRSVRVERRDAQRLVADFRNRPASLIYLDPPYLGERVRGYDHDKWSPGQHASLLVELNKAKCMILISGYESPLYEERLARSRGWACRTFRASTRGHNGRDFGRTEVVWCNAAFREAQRSQRVGLRLSAVERADKKLNPTRGR